MGGSISSFFGSGPATPPNLQTYQPKYTSQADTGAFQGIQSINSNDPYLQNQAQYKNIMNQGVNSPYAAGAQTAANTAGGQFAAAGTQGAGVSTGLNSGAMALLPYISQVENTAMDPQNALYNQQLRNVQDQANVSNAQNGVSGSPFAAGVSNQATTNFNNAWGAQKLANQAAGINAAATGLGAAGAAGTNAQNIGQSAAASSAAGGAVPNNAYLANLSNMLNALNQYGQSQTAGNANTQTATQDFLNYLQQGETQANNQAQLNQQNYQNQQQYVNAQNSQLAGQVNSGLGLGGGISSLIGSGGSSAGSGSSANNLMNAASIAMMFL